MREWWPMVLNRNRNRFRPFPAKSNDPNSINSPKSHFWDIFGHIGHLLILLGQISTCEISGRWYSTIIGTVLNHFQPNQMTQIGLGVQKVCFRNFFRFLLSVRVKKAPKKISKNFLAFSCFRMTQKFSYFFFKNF